MNEMTREELLQKAKPILFNTEMVRAILDGRKKVTRRICKDANDYSIPDMGYYDAEKRTYAIHSYADKEHTDKLSIAERNCPICPGDILYVRETWQYAYDLDDNDQIIEETGRYYYAAGPDDALPHFTHWLDATTGEYKGCMPWHPSIHMPKEAARIFLQVRNVRVERLQDMTAEDCKKEGGETDRYLDMQEEAGICGIQCETLKDYFAYSIWDSVVPKQELNKYGWDANPWVWVIEFERLEVGE